MVPHIHIHDFYLIDNVLCYYINKKAPYQFLIFELVDLIVCLLFICFSNFIINTIFQLCRYVYFNSCNHAM